MGYYEEVAADSPRLWHKFDASTVDNAGAATMGAVTSGGSGYVFDNSLFTKGIRMVDSTSYAQYNLPEDVFNGQWTIEAWFKISTSKEYNNILRISPANGKHIGLRVRGSAHASQYRPNTIEIFTYDGTSWGDVTHVSTKNVNDGEWHHVVVKSTGTGTIKALSMHIDGAKYTTGTAPSTRAISGMTGGAMKIGSGPDAGGVEAWRDGVIDDIAIYNTALSDARIAAHYDAAFVSAGYTAQPMTASADVVQPAVNHKTVFVLPITEDAYVDSNNASTNFGNSDVLQVNAVFQTHSFLKVSGLPSGALDGKTLESATLTLTPTSTTTGVASDAVVNVATVDAAWDESTITYTNMPSTTAAGTSPIGNVAVDIPINITVGSAALATNGFALITGTAKNFSFYSSGYGPGNNNSTKNPYVTVVLASPIPVDVPAGPMTASAATPPATVSGSTSVAYVAEPLTANAELMDATASTGANTHINVAPMYASVDMPNAVATAEQFIDLAIEAEPMDAYAAFGQSGFASPRTVAAEPMTAVAETVDATVDTQRGPRISAQVMNASAVWKQPSAINGNPITVSEVDDNYFQRIYPDVDGWLRLNDLGSTARNRVKILDSEGTYHGVQVGQHNGPDGRHSVYFDGTASISGPVVPNFDSDDSTLEFSLRTSKGTQFLMSTSAKGGYSGDSPNELYLKDGRIEYRVYERGTSTPVRYQSFTGFKRIDDGEWHTIAIRSRMDVAIPENRGVEIYIDGILDIRRVRSLSKTYIPWASQVFVWAHFPEWIGSRPEAVSPGLKMPPLPSALNFVGDMSEIAWFNEERSTTDLERDYYAFMGWTPIEPDNMTATADMPQGARGKGNQKRILHLWWFAREDGYRLYGNKMNFNPVIGSKGNTGVFDFEDYKVFSKPVALMQQPYIGASEYQDRVDDSDTLIDLEWDVDIRDYDVITFGDWPDESAEFDIWRVEIPNFQAKYERLLAQLRDANDLGIGLYVTNPRLAVELGIVDRVEGVPTLKEHYGTWMTAPDNMGFQGNAAGNYDYGSAVKFPWNITDDARLTGSSTPGAYGTGVPMNTDPSFLDYKAYFYADNNFNNKFRVRALVDGLTDIPSYIIKDAIMHHDRDVWGDEVRALNYEDRREGLTIGDEFIFHGTNVANFQYDEFMNDMGITFTRPYGYYATPVANVKAGTIVTTFGASHWDNKSEVENPYKDYATTIVLDVGDTLAGRPVGGRIFVNFTEQPNRWYTTMQANILPGSEWDDGSASWPNNYKPDTEAQREWEWSFTRMTGSNTQISGRSVYVDVVMPDGTTASVRQSTPDSLMSVSYNALFNTAYLPHWDMTRRGLWWVGRGETIAEGEVRVGDTAMTAEASMPEATAVAERSTVITTQTMVALAQMPRVAESTIGDVEVVTLPATATATFTGFSKVIPASPMEATATLVENFNMVHATGEQVVLTLHGVDATLYLKEEA